MMGMTKKQRFTVETNQAVVNNLGPFINQFNGHKGLFLWKRLRGERKKWICEGMIVEAIVNGDYLSLSSLKISVLGKRVNALDRSYTESLLSVRVKDFDFRKLPYEITFSRYYIHDDFCKEKGIRRVKAGNYIPI